MQIRTTLLCALTAVAGSPAQSQSGAACIKLYHDALTLVGQGQSADDERMLSAALAGRDRLDPVFAGLIMSNVAGLLIRSGRPKEAEAMAKRSVHALEERLTSNNIFLLRPLHTLAAAQLQQGETSRTRDTIERMRSIPITRPADRALVNAAAASLLEAQGRWPEAESQYAVAIQAMKEGGHGDTADEGVLLLDIGGLYIKEHRMRDALQALTEALAVFEHAPDSEPFDRVNLLWVRGAWHGRLREWKQAEQDFADALSIADRGSRMDPAVIRPLLVDYATVLRKDHRRREATAIELRITALGGEARRAVVDVSDLLAKPR